MREKPSYASRFTKSLLASYNLSMTTIKQKAFVYITYQNKLLVFIHPHAPEAGIQVPAGTVKDGEDTAVAALREAVEETGLADFTMQSFLGEATFHDHTKNEIHYRFFYHLTFDTSPQERWQNFETDPCAGTDNSYLFEFYWVDLTQEYPNLIAQHDAFLPQLMTHLLK